MSNNEKLSHNSNPKHDDKYEPYIGPRAFSRGIDDRIRFLAGMLKSMKLLLLSIQTELF